MALKRQTTCLAIRKALGQDVADTTLFSEQSIAIPYLVKCLQISAPRLMLQSCQSPYKVTGPNESWMLRPVTQLTYSTAPYSL